MEYRIERQRSAKIELNDHRALFRSLEQVRREVTFAADSVSHGIRPETVIARLRSVIEEYEKTLLSVGRHQLGESEEA